MLTFPADIVRTGSIWKWNVHNQYIWNIYNSFKDLELDQPESHNLNPYIWKMYDSFKDLDISLFLFLQSALSMFFKIWSKHSTMWVDTNINTTIVLSEFQLHWTDLLMPVTKDFWESSLHLSKHTTCKYHQSKQIHIHSSYSHTSFKWFCTHTATFPTERKEIWLQDLI